MRYDIDYAFLADAAETSPGQKFNVLGGGISRIGGPSFPLRHPHLALVVSLIVTAPELDHEHEIRFVLLDPDGGEVASATSQLVARGPSRGARHEPDVLSRPLGTSPAAQGHEIYDLLVEIAHPEEADADRLAAVDQYLMEAGLQSLDRVANTIFPAHLAALKRRPCWG